MHHALVSSSSDWIRLKFADIGGFRPPCHSAGLIILSPVERRSGTISDTIANPGQANWAPLSFTTSPSLLTSRVDNKSHWLLVCGALRDTRITVSFFCFFSKDNCHNWHCTYKLIREIFLSTALKVHKTILFQYFSCRQLHCYLLASRTVYCRE